MHLIDTHAHLDEQSLSVEIDEVIARALDQNVTGIVTIGTTAASSRLSVELAQKYAGVFAAVGIHPNYASLAQPDDWRQIEQMATESKVVALGETGLDRYWDHTPLAIQQDYFDRHLDLSRRTGKPFIVHCREAEADVLIHLQRAAKQSPLNGLMHSFVGSPDTAKTCLDLGLYLSFSGMLTYKKNDELRQIASQVPLDRLLVETDAPYLSPVPHRGKRNEPAFVKFTALMLAECHKKSLAEMAEITTNNARRLFKLPTF